MAEEDGSSSSDDNDSTDSNDQQEEAKKNHPRWTESSRWEKESVAQEQGGFLLKEKYGTYFRLPNPSALMTKVICTIGPATMNPTTLGRMMDAGMSAARINMSHGSHEYMKQVIQNVRQVAQARRKLCPIILDTKGPEIRVKRILGPSTTADDDISNSEMVTLQSGEDVLLLTGVHATTEGDSDPKKVVSNKKMIKKQVAVTYPYLASAVCKGDVVLLDDGRISLMVTSIPNDDQVHTQVIEGGNLVVNKGVNLPGCPLELPHLTEKDEQDILFGISMNVEYIAHSFTRSATGVNQVRELPGVVESGTHIIAKIESQEGLDNFASILRVSDGIMVARGDLGVEIPLERVCSVQKRLVASCNAVGKPVIVATELLDSMINHPRPTRAEASDVANAVFDGADCVMLSGETAVGKYPVEAIQVMTRICKEAELDVASSLRAMAANGGGRGRVLSLVTNRENSRWLNGTPRGIKKGEGVALRDAFAKSAIVAAKETNADLILALSRTGLTANALAKFFSSVPVMVLSTSPQVCAQVLLHRSVTPYMVDSLKRESCVPRAISKAIELGLVGPGSRVLLLTGKDDMMANRLETFIVGEGVVLPHSPSLPGDSLSV